ncbi:histidinol-phosphate transaminase [Pseudoalteromonas sp. OOF1S-7]|uniref:histidinol-phosphate transaminase n=1 Tax=Pseudoalteromonas sp. OOF1S-7 TaxID=2917757 RepID=UPI001EF616EC|nr:histidinol-phosphate transaminase [Pseudoalteromonas sp. OOF1S-7]MCG7533955.1 histidinol-phosphate transaminase [Pseudoalteromonas sp. OOF1S-7]
MSQIELPENIASLSAYSSAKSEKLTGTTWLNANESPYSRRVSLNFEALNRYPDPQPEAVINAYASYAGLNPEQVLMTRGADEGIELLVRTYCTPGQDKIALFLPTYGMYKVTADTHNVGITALEQSLLQQGSAAEIAGAVGNAKLVFICNPNNPTGATVSTDKIAAIAAALKDKALVIVDEAYIEFCEQLTAANLLSDFENLVVLRTLSKAFALAGLRTGFTLASPNVLAPVRKVIAPYPVSAVVAQIAQEALTPDAITQMRRQVSILNKAKEKLTEVLGGSEKIANVMIGEGNFITVQVRQVNDIKQAMQSGLIMRPFTLFGEDNWLRISIGSEQELEQVRRWLTQPQAEQ